MVSNYLISPRRIDTYIWAVRSTMKSLKIIHGETGERKEDDSQIASASGGNVTDEDLSMDGPPMGRKRALTIAANGRCHL
jgi:hypothetical protein